MPEIFQPQDGTHRTRASVSTGHVPMMAVQTHLDGKFGLRPEEVMYFQRHRRKWQLDEFLLCILVPEGDTNEGSLSKFPGYREQWWSLKDGSVEKTEVTIEVTA